MYIKNEKLNYRFLFITYLNSVQRDQWERINGYSFRPCKNSPETVSNVPHIGIDIIRAVCPTVCEIFTHSAPLMVDWDEWDQRVTELM